MRRPLAALLVATALALTGCTGTGVPEAPAPSQAPSTAALVLMPDVVGQNADVALDMLRKEGFTNVDLGTVDGRHLIVLPQNWTVRTQSAAAGTSLATDAKIVLGCARIGESHWPLQL